MTPRRIVSPGGVCHAPDPTLLATACGKTPATGWSTVRRSKRRVDCLVCLRLPERWAKAAA